MELLCLAVTFGFFLASGALIELCSWLEGGR